VRLSKISSLIGVALLSTSALAASQEKSAFPHVAEDIVNGDLEHATLHLDTDFSITKMWYGKRVEVSIDELIRDFNGCKLIRYGISSYAPKDGDAIIVNCGKDYNQVIQTGQKIDLIAEIHYFSEAVAMPSPY
jgi:hypothetical protein